MRCLNQQTGRPLVGNRFISCGSILLCRARPRFGSSHPSNNSVRAPAKHAKHAKADQRRHFCSALRRSLFGDRTSNGQKLLYPGPLARLACLAGNSNCSETSKFLRPRAIHSTGSAVGSTGSSSAPPGDSERSSPWARISTFDGARPSDGLLHNRFSLLSFAAALTRIRESTAKLTGNHRTLGSAKE